MKNKYFFAALAALTLSSCIDLAEMNVDPNNPSTTNPALLLTGVSYRTFRGADIEAGYAVKQLVQVSEENRHQVYKFSRGSFDAYAILRDVVKMEQQADKNNQTACKAIGLFLEAHHYYMMTMQLGDIPCSEALRGETDGVYQPRYDAQEKVMEAVLAKLDEANRLLSASGEIVTGDIIYRGDLSRWRRLVNAYRLRVLMSLSNKTTVGGLDVKATFADVVKNQPLMTSGADNGQVVFLDQQDNRYPFFNDSSFGSGRYMDSTYVAAMASRRDPRLFAICTQTPAAAKEGKAIDDFSSYDGGDPAVPYSLVNDKVKCEGVSKPASRYYRHATNEPIVLMGYTEQQLILAEGVARGWIEGDAGALYESAVRESFDFYRSYAPAAAQYLDAGAADSYLTGKDVAWSAELTFDQKLERIVMQKYIPSFLQGNRWLTYFEQLRTGYPEFRRAAGVKLPWRFMYPQSEYNSNPDNVEAALTSQFGGNDRISDQPWWIKK